MDGKFEGLIVSTIAESGPNPVISLTSLDEITVLRLCIVGMTIVSMGSGYEDKLPYYRFHGPIPVPGKSDYEALAMTFSVKAPNSSDSRVVKYGRLSNFWLIFNEKYRYELTAILGDLERVLAQEIRKIIYEDDLNDQENMKSIFENLQKITISEKFIVTPKIKDEHQIKRLDEPVYAYTVNQQGELVTIKQEELAEIESFPILVIVNTILQRIFVLKTRSGIPNRLLFFANRAALNLNTKSFKSKFSINEIYEPLEAKILLEQTSILFKR